MRRSWGEQQEFQWRKKGGSPNEWKITDIWLKVQELQTLLGKGQRMQSLLAGRASLNEGRRGKREEGWGCAAAGRTTELSSTSLGWVLHLAQPLLFL